MTIRETLQGWCTDIFAGDMFKGVETILKLNPSTSEYQTVWNVVCNIYEDVCVPVGMGLVLIYFVVNLYERAMQQNNFDLDHIVKMLLKLFFGLYFIEHGLELMASIYSLGFSFVSDIAATGGKEYSSAGVVKKVWTSLTGEAWKGEWGKLESIGYFLAYGISLLIPFLATKILMVVVNFVCYSRLIEFYIRTAMAPIALSDFFTEGTHSNGWRFVKGYIAVALQSGIIMLAVIVFNSVGNALLGSEVESYWVALIKYLALAFATVGIMLKSLSLTKEIVGAN